MSRIGKLPIPLPDKVSCDIKGNEVTVKGPKGELTSTFRPEMSLKVDDGNVVVERGSDKIEERAFHGLTRALLANMVEGVSEGFEKTLEIVGVGYRCSLQGKSLDMQLGFSHPVSVDPPEGITFAVEGTTTIKVQGIDKQLVGQTAAKIRALRKPEPYKGKGIKYADERIRRKVGKAAGK